MLTRARLTTVLGLLFLYACGSPATGFGPDGGQLSPDAGGEGEPGAVNDLRVVSTTVDEVVLGWTAVDDGTGLPARYALRHQAPTLIWEQAQASETLLTGEEIGAAVTHTVKGLEAGTSYQFQLVSYRQPPVDAVYGPLSNKVSATTRSLPPPPPDPTDLTLTLHRLDGGSGTVLVSNGVPLLRGWVTPENIDQVTLWIDEVEQPIYVEGLGRFEDLSYRSLLLQFESAVEGEDTGTAVLRFSVPRTLNRQKTRVTFYGEDWVPRRPEAREDPKLAGWPDAVAMPPRQFVQASGIFHSLADVDEVAILVEGDAVARAEKWRDWVPTWMLAYDFENAAGGNSEAFDRQNILRFPDPHRFAGAQPEAWAGPLPPEYAQWRNRFYEGSVSGGSMNYYDAAMIFFQQWAMRGELEYFKAAVAYAWTYMHANKFRTGTYGDGTERISSWRVIEPNNQMPEGLGMAYLMTGDLDFLNNIQQVRSGATEPPPGADTPTRQGGFASYTSNHATWGQYNSSYGEPRPIARILLARLTAWRITRPASETESPSRENHDWLERVQEGINRTISTEPLSAWMLQRPLEDGGVDGRAMWVRRMSSQCEEDPFAYYNVFMQPMVVDALIKSYEHLDYRRDEITAVVKAAIDRLWDEDWPFYKGEGVTRSFRGWFGSSTGLNCTPPDRGYPDLTLMYPHTWAWYFKVSGDPAYKAIAEEILYWGVGTRLNGTDGPYLGASSIASRKVRREVFCYSSKTFGYLKEGR
jgi:hypothetical protein